MKIKSTGLFVAAALMLGVMTIPASAAISVGPHAGVFRGQAIVGKTATFCNNLGEHDISGGGIGLIPGAVEPAKNAWYGIDAQDSVLDVPGGNGDLKLCGRLTTPLQDTPLDVQGLTGIGASCLATKGWGGKGRAVLDGVPPATGPQELWISNLGWKLTLGGTFIVTGDIGGESKKKADLLVAAVQALSQGAVVGCVEKTTVGKDNSQLFDVVAAYTVVPGAGGNVPKKAPKK